MMGLEKSTDAALRSAKEVFVESALAEGRQLNCIQVKRFLGSVQIICFGRVVNIELSPLITSAHPEQARDAINDLVKRHITREMELEFCFRFRDLLEGSAWGRAELKRLGGYAMSGDTEGVK